MATLTVDNITSEFAASNSTAQKIEGYNTPLGALDLAWSSWTPTWTGLAGGAAAAATIVAKYRQIGKLVFCRLSIVFASATPISGALSFTLPVERAAYGASLGLTPLGLVRFLDSSAPARSEGVIVNITTTTALIAVYDCSGTYLTALDLSSTVPFAWATGDSIATEFFYEAA